MALELSSRVKVRRTYLGKKCCGVFSNLLVDRMHVNVFLLATSARSRVTLTANGEGEGDMQST